MTKAATIGEKRRRKRGRPVSDRPRTASGRTMTKAQEAAMREAQDELKRPALERRCMKLGWPNTVEHRRRADDARLGNPAGLAWAAGWFDGGNPDTRDGGALDLYLALCAYRDDLLAWGRAFEAPWPHPRCCAWAREAVTPSILPAGGDLAIFDMRTPEEWKADIRAKEAALSRLLTMSQRAALAEMVGDGADDWTPSGAEYYRETVVAAAKVLARHYRLRL